MERIQNFKSFSTLKTQLREEAENQQKELKRGESATAFTELLRKYNVSSVSEITEDQLEKFASELFNVSEEEEEQVEEGRAFIFAASKAKKEGKTEFEWNGKKYPVTLKEAEEGKEVSTEEVNEDVFADLESEIMDMDTDAYNNLAMDFNVDPDDPDMMTDFIYNGLDKAGAKDLIKRIKKGVYESNGINENYEVIFSDGVSQMKKFRSEQQALDFMRQEIKSNKKLRDIAVYKPGMHSTTQTELVVAFWGERSYLDNVSKRDPKLAAKKLEESVVNEGKRERNNVVTAWKKSGLTDLKAIAKLYADAMEDANFHQEMVTAKAIGSASQAKKSDLAGIAASVISGAAGWDGYAIANGTVDFLREIGAEEAANKLYGAISKFDLNESVNLNSLEEIIEEGTRGQFGKIYKTGEIASVYTHYDSYPEHMLPTIKKGYKKGTDVDAVLGKGDNSGLEADPSKMKFYGDPRSLKPTMGNIKNLKKYISDADGQGAEYIYLFDERDQKWYMVDVYGDRELVPAFESVVIEAEVQLMAEVGNELSALFSKLYDLEEETTDTDWRKSIGGIIKALTQVETKIKQASSKLGIIPTHEGNAFGDAVRKAKEAGEEEFEFDGKTYKVEENAKDEQRAMELYVELVDLKKGKHSEAELKSMSDEELFNLVQNEGGLRGNDAKAIAKELAKIAKG
jgi:hypothetical protein